MMSGNVSKTKIRVQTNILDPVHDQLDQRLYDGTKPRPAKMAFVEKRIFNALREYIAEPEEFFDLYMTGSITTYQYSDGSDCDISLFPHWKELSEYLGKDPKEIRKDLILLVINHIDGTVIPGTPYPIQSFVTLPDDTPASMFKEGLRSAWSFQTNDWVVPPDHNRVHNVQHEFPLIYLRAHAIGEKMRYALEHDPEAAKQLYKRVHLKRTNDQRADRGDFSEGNVMYKYLANAGYFDRLRDIGLHIAKTSELVHGPEPGGQPYEKSQIVTQCAWCHRFELPNGTWTDVNPMPGAPVSHGICPDDLATMMPGSKSASESKSMQVIYNFQKDRIILGSYAESGKLPFTILVGEYHNGHVTLNEQAHQWLNTNYFKKLWLTSFPTYPLKGVHLKHVDGTTHRLGLVQVPQNRDGIEYDQAFIYLGDPYHRFDIGGTEHYELIENLMSQLGFENTDFLEIIPNVMGHIGIVKKPNPAYDPSKPLTFANDDGTLTWNAPYITPINGPSNEFPRVVFFASHKYENLRQETALRQEALRAIRQAYPNTVDITDTSNRNWWTGI